MSEAIWIKLIDQLPAIVTALGVIIGVYLSYRSNMQNKANAVKITEVHESVNGKMEKLMEISNAKAHAEGMKDESDAQITRNEPLQVAIVEHPVPVKVVSEEI